MVNAGFNPLEEMARKTGKSIGELKEEMSKGAISSKMVQDAFISATSAGGKFFGMSSEGAKTLNGQISMLGESFDMMFNEIGEKGEGVIMDAVKAGTYLVDNYETIGKAIEGLIIVYGTYKTALIVNAALTGGLKSVEEASIVVKNLHAAATWALTAALKVLNNVMAMNPYVRVGAAVVALAGTIYALTDTTTAATRAQKRLNEANAEVEKATATEVEKLDELRDKLETTKRGSDEWKAAKDAIIEQYGQYDSKLAAEIDRTGTLTTSYENLTLAIRKSIAARQLKQFYDTNMDATQKEIQERKQKVYEKLTGRYDKGQAKVIMSYVNDYIATGKGLDKKIKYTARGLLKDASGTGTVADVLKNAAGFMSTTALWDVKKARDEEVANKQNLKDYIAINSISQADANEILYGIKPTGKGKKETKRDEKYWEDKKKDAQGKLKALDYIEAKGKEGRALKKKIELYDKILLSFSVSNSDGGHGGGGHSGGGHSGDVSFIKERKIFTPWEQSDEVVELENQVEQSRIDALMDGSEKTLSAMKLAHKKELEQIEKQRQDYLKKKQEEAKAEFEANPKNNGKAFDASSVTLTQDEQDKFDTIRENTNKKYKNETDAFLRQQEQAHTAYLKEYGSMQEQRAAIAREFDEKIAYESNEWTKKTLEKQKETALASFDFSEFQKAINWDVVFGDLTKLSDTALSMLEKQLLAVREKISSKGILSADDTEQLKTISNALENVVAQKVSNAPLEAVVNSISEYRSSLDELKRVQEDMDRINATSYDGVMTLGEAYENALEKQDMATVAKIQDTYVTIKYKDATGKTRIGVMKYIDALKRLQKQQTRTSASAKKLQEGINGVGGKLSQIAQIGGEVTRLADAIGVKMPESIGMTIDGIGDMGEAMEAFDISKPGSFLNVKNYIKFATGVTNAFKGIGKTIGGIFGWGGSAAKSLREYQSAVAKYSALRDVWDDLIDRKKKYLDMSWGSDAYKTQKEIEALIEAETKSIVAEANAYLGTKDKHHGKSHTNYTWQSDIFSNGNFSKGSDHNNEAFWEELEKKLKENGLTKDRNGKDLNIKGVGDLFNLTYDELVMIKTLYPERWALLSKETREYLDKYMESMKNADEATRKYMDSIIGSISEISEALRKFADDSKASAEDVMRAFNETINNSIWKELTKEGSEYYRRMEEYQKHYEEAIRDGHLSEEEKKELEEEYLGIYNDINEKYDKRVAEMGTGDTSSSQNATANGISQISYEQANDITGLVTASNIAGEQRNVKLDTANAHFSLMNATLADIKAYMLNSPQDNNIADETRTILANSYLELRGINENTGNSAAHLKEIRSDIKDMKRIIKDL